MTADQRARSLERGRAHYALHRERSARVRKEWAEKNPEKIKANKARYYRENKEVLTAKMRERNATMDGSTREKHNRAKGAWKAKKKAECPEFKLIVNMRERIRFAMLRVCSIRSERTKQLLGCSPSFLRGYIEAKFEIGMTWENYGEWHVDHIIPCAGFDLRNPEAQKECFHYSNLQPLWAEENLSKNDRMPSGISARTLKLLH